MRTTSGLNTARIITRLSAFFYVDIFMMLLAVLYGCETWSVTLKEELKLRMLEKRLLRIS
jgi:hypothetical protein